VADLGEGRSPGPLILDKTKKITEGRKPGIASKKPALPAPLAQGLNPPPRLSCYPTRGSLKLGVAPPIGGLRPPV